MSPSGLTREKEIPPDVAKMGSNAASSVLFALAILYKRDFGSTDYGKAPRRERISGYQGAQGHAGEKPSAALRGEGSAARARKYLSIEPNRKGRTP
jgi:hypothetical protein